MDKYATDSDFGLGLLKILGLQGKAIKEINISVCAHKKVEVTCRAMKVTKSLSK